jgi:hypothetical protein
MRIGYSCWGFLGRGTLDTPDGGRSHRLTFINGLQSRGHEVVFLQLNRDLAAGENFCSRFKWDYGFPDIDLLFLEWRWPIFGRNTGPKPRSPDLRRQSELLDVYTLARQTPTLIWDKDLQMSLENALRRAVNVVVCEAARLPSPGSEKLRFPVDDTKVRWARSAVREVYARNIAYDLIYIGNQYDRDTAFERYFALPARTLKHAVFGSWQDKSAWPHVDFRGSVAFGQVGSLYEQSLSTVLLTPERLARVGQVTQRFFESLLSFCIPIGTADIFGIDAILPRDLIASNGDDVVEISRMVKDRFAKRELEPLFESCLDGLGEFKLSRQLEDFGTATGRLGLRG